MTKDDKNISDQVFLTFDDPWSGFWEDSGKLYFWDLDNICYVWMEDKKYWVESDRFFFLDYDYDGVYPDTNVNFKDAKKRFPGSMPIVILTNKKRKAKRARIRRQRIAWTTDSQVFEDPINLPRGFGFTDSETRREFKHKTFPELHPVGKVSFYPGAPPGFYGALSRRYHIKYFGRCWVAGDYTANPFNGMSKGFESKNEAQVWVIAQLREQQQAQRAAAKALKTNKEGEKNG